MADLQDNSDAWLAEQLAVACAELRDSGRDESTISVTDRPHAPPDAASLLAIMRDLEAAAQEWKSAAGCSRVKIDELAAHLPCDLPGGRYTVVEEIARGGMGAVYRTIDADLERRLAVKVMGAHLPLGGVCEQRFLAEARITGQLQHPGVAPVHEIGHLTDGRPFFAMKLIEGSTLAHMLSARKEAQDDLPGFLKIFEHIAQTLAYAHAQGVIHRDLKPANVMVGAFGEVQVMDWGLAKRIRGASSDAVSGQLPEASTIGNASTGLTQAGTILGTLAYMPPEQAQGNADRLDERCDVFGLGAILCVILTGFPPYGRSEGNALQRRVEHGDLNEALSRLGQCGADVELVALAKECLAARAEDRLRDASVVAARVSAHLVSVQERLKAAEIEQASARTRLVEERKRRRIRAALAATALLLALVGAGVAVRYYVERVDSAARLAQSEREVAGILDGVTTALNALDRQTTHPVQHRALLDEPLRWEGSLAAVRADLRRAADLVQAAPEPLNADLVERLDTLKKSLAAAEADRRSAMRFDAIPMKVASLLTNKWDFTNADRMFVEAFSVAGFVIEFDDIDDLAARMRASRIRWSLVAALDTWCVVLFETEREKTDSLQRLARAVDPDPRRDAFRRRAVWEDRAALERIMDDWDDLHESPHIANVFSLVLQARDIEAAPKLRRVLERNPRDAWLYFRMAGSTRDLHERVGYYRAAIAARPEFFPAHSNLGFDLFELGRHDEALASYRKAIEIDPQDARTHFRLGNLFYHRKQFDKAGPAYERTLEIDNRPAGAWVNLGLVRYEQGKIEQAVAMFRKSLERKEDARAHVYLGKAYRKLGKLNDAIASCERALKIDPKLADAYSELGLALESTDLEKAIGHHRKALEIDPQQTHARISLAAALGRKNQWEEAVVHLEKAIERDPQAFAAYYHLGFARLRQKNLAAAATNFAKASALSPNLADAHFQAGNAYAQLSEFDKAEPSLRRTVELNPEHGLAHSHLGFILNRRGKPKEALGHLKAAAALLPKDSGAQVNLGVALELDGQSDLAGAAYQRAIDLNMQHADAHRNLGRLHMTAGRFKEALPLLKRGHELGKHRPNWPDPAGKEVSACERLLEADVKLPAILSGNFKSTDAGELLALGDLCREYKKQYVAALGFYEDAFAMDQRILDKPASARLCAAYAAVLAAAGQGQDSHGLDDSRRMSLRQRALVWLQRELTAYRLILAKAPPAEREPARMRIKDLFDAPELTSVREPADLARLPASQADAWRTFWAEAEKLLNSQD